MPEEWDAEVERMRKLLIVFLAAVCLLSACGRGPLAAEKPCVMVGGTLYWLSGGEALDALPEGCAFAGRLERVKDTPRADLTGSGVPDGSEVYVREADRAAVYVRAEETEAWLCFTVEALQYACLMAGGALYMREDDYRRAYPNEAGSGFDGVLPETARRLGKIGSTVRDALPTRELQTNFAPFAGYTVYADGERDDAVYIRSEPGSSGAIRFLRLPE